MPSRHRRPETAASAPAASARHSSRQPEPPSFSPSSRGAQPAQVGRPRAARRTSGSSRTTPMPAAQAAPSGNGWGNGGNRGHRVNRGLRSGNALVRRHPVRRFIGILLLVILMALVVLAGGGWFWINARLNREQMLTDAPGSGATTWLLLGSDQRDGSPGAGQDTSITGFRTDTILVLTKPRHGAASLISVPRDSLVKEDGRYMKINAVAYTSGYRSLTSQIEDITGHKVDHVALIRFGGLSKVVDAMGGVNLCYDADVNDPRSGMVWSKGCHQADGGMALAFTRMRYSDPKGDFGRHRKPVLDQPQLLPQQARRLHRSAGSGPQHRAVRPVGPRQSRAGHRRGHLTVPFGRRHPHSTTCQVRPGIQAPVLSCWKHDQGPFVSNCAPLIGGGRPQAFDRGRGWQSTLCQYG